VLELLDQSVGEMPIPNDPFYPPEVKGDTDCCLVGPIARGRRFGRTRLRLNAARSLCRLRILNLAKDVAFKLFAILCGEIFDRGQGVNGEMPLV